MVGRRCPASPCRGPRAARRSLADGTVTSPPPCSPATPARCASRVRGVRRRAGHGRAPLPAGPHRHPAGRAPAAGAGRRADQRDPPPPRRHVASGWGRQAGGGARLEAARSPPARRRRASGRHLLLAAPPPAVAAGLDLLGHPAAAGRTLDEVLARSTRPGHPRGEPARRRAVLAAARPPLGPHPRPGPRRHGRDLPVAAAVAAPAGPRTRTSGAGAGPPSRRSAASCGRWGRSGRGGRRRGAAGTPAPPSPPNPALGDLLRDATSTWTWAGPTGAHDRAATRRSSGLVRELLVGDDHDVRSPPAPRPQPFGPRGRGWARAGRSTASRPATGASPTPSAGTGSGRRCCGSSTPPTGAGRWSSRAPGLDPSWRPRRARRGGPAGTGGGRPAAGSARPHASGRHRAAARRGSRERRARGPRGRSCWPCCGRSACRTTRSSRRPADGTLVMLAIDHLALGQEIRYDVGAVAELPVSRRTTCATSGARWGSPSRPTTRSCSPTRTSTTCAPWPS